MLHEVSSGDTLAEIARRKQGITFLSNDEARLYIAMVKPMSGEYYKPHWYSRKQRRNMAILRPGETIILPDKAEFNERRLHV